MDTYDDKEVLTIEQPKPLYDVVDEEPIKITDDMLEYSSTRTGNHIARVIAFGEKLGFNFEQHDHTKFSAELIESYILIDNAYRKDLDPAIPYTSAMAEASFKHIKAEPHHPEYWDDTVVMNSNVDRDGSETTVVNAYEMSVPAICEMVCDWCAMSVEVGGSPIEWAENNIGSRWKFTDDQEELIFVLLRMLWDPATINEVNTEVAEEEKPKVFQAPEPDEFSWTTTPRLGHISKHRE